MNAPPLQLLNEPPTSQILTEIAEIEVALWCTASLQSENLKERPTNSKNKVRGGEMSRLWPDEDRRRIGEHKIDNTI